MQTIINLVYTTVFSYIAVIEDLIGYNNFVNYKSLANYTCFII